MNQVIERLLAVQDLDARILKMKEKLAEGPRRLSDDNRELESHRARFEDARHRAKEALRNAERKNAELESVDAKIQDLNGKLNAARSNKEYEALKHEIAGHKADYDILEEEALKQWEVSEEREEEAGREEVKIRAIEEKLAGKQAEWEQTAHVIEDELGELEGARAERAAEVSDAWMRIYERVLELRGCPAVVEIVDQYCQGCQMSVTVHDVTRAMRGQELVQCNACSRILFAENL